MMLENSDFPISDNKVLTTMMDWHEDRGTDEGDDE